MHNYLILFIFYLHPPRGFFHPLGEDCDRSPPAFGDGTIPPFDIFSFIFDIVIPHRLFWQFKIYIDPFRYMTDNQNKYDSVKSHFYWHSSFFYIHIFLLRAVQLHKRQDEIKNITNKNICKKYSESGVSLDANAIKKAVVEQDKSI